MPPPSYARVDSSLARQGWTQPGGHLLLVVTFPPPFGSVRRRLEALDSDPGVDDSRVEQVVWGDLGLLDAALLVAVGSLPPGDVNVLSVALRCRWACPAASWARRRARVPAAVPLAGALQQLADRTSLDALASFVTGCSRPSYVQG